MSKPLMSLRLPEDKQERWSEKAEELGLESRTALIETAVENYIARGGFDGQGELAQKKAMSDLQESVNRLESELAEMHDELRAVKRQTSGASADVKELAHDVLSFLPEVDEDHDPRAYEQYQKPLEEYEPAGMDVPVTVDALVTWLQEDPDVDHGYPLTHGDVMEALDYLRSQYIARELEIGGETRWVKEV